MTSKTARRFNALARLETAVLPGPSDIAAFEIRYDLDLAAACLCPARVGGDLWGLLPLSDTRLGLFCADVCGHGIEAAGFARLVAHYFRRADLKALTPGEVLSDFNRFLHDRLPAGKFVALMYGIVDITADRLDYACSTFMPPLLRKGTNGAFTLLAGEGLPLGFLPDAAYDTLSTPFPPGSALVVYSDALVETPLPPDAVYSPARLRDRLDELRGAGSRVINDTLVAGLHLDRNPLSDELTLICLQRGC